MNSLTDYPKSILITSAIPSEGKSLISANLAYSCANHGRKTILIDFDLRRPGLHKFCDLENKQGLDINNIKVLLANSATEMLHGKDNAILSEKTANDVFKNEGSSENLPSINIKFNKNIDIYLNEQIVEVGFTNSKSEARKLIKNSGVKVNRVLVSDELKTLSINDFDDNKELLVSVGKKKHFIIKLLD